ncbi:MAG: TraB/GumN family protein [Steroidobacteraceae bacterium]
MMRTGRKNSFAKVEASAKRSQLFSLFVLQAMSALLFLQSARAAEVRDMTSHPERATSYDEIIITGQQPGPRLLKVTKDGHALWVLPTISLLPDDITWHSPQLEEVLEEKPAILSSEVGVSWNPISGLSLLLTGQIKKKSKANQSLSQVLPAELYERYSQLSQLYTGSPTTYERYTPAWAGIQLQAKALKQHQLSSSAIDKQLITIAAHQHLKLIKSTLYLHDLYSNVRKSNKMAQQEIASLQALVTNLENIQAIKQQSRLWAAGRMDILETMREYEKQPGKSGSTQGESICRDDTLGNPLFLLYQIETLQHWFETAESSIKANRNTVAAIPIRNLIGCGGYLRRFMDAGYTIEQT